MSLLEIPLSLDLATPSDSVESLIRKSEVTIDEFFAAGLGQRYRKYIPSDPQVVYAAISSLLNEGHLEGGTFCEWGCGFAIATGIASLLGMKAYGIEIEEELAKRARRLMGQLQIPVEILRTDYLPEGFDESEGIGGKDLVTPESITVRGESVPLPQYDDLDPDEVDLFFVYPWPDQEEMMMDLFVSLASDGAILLIYQGDGEISAFLRVEGPDDSLIGAVEDGHDFQSQSQHPEEPGRMNQ